MNKWYVISGGPSTGKTSVINELAKRGYATVPEMARHYIDEQLALGRTLAEIQGDSSAFQHAVLEHQLETEARHDPHTTTFFDRGIPDALAYYRYHHLSEDACIADAVAHCFYVKIFLLDPLPFISDYARIENEAQQRELCALIHQVYESLPFPVERVPVVPLDERVAYVLARL